MDLLNNLTEQLTSESAIKSLTERSGVGADQISALLGQAMPQLLGALTDNASSTEGSRLFLYFPAYVYGYFRSTPIQRMSLSRFFRQIPTMARRFLVTFLVPTPDRSSTHWQETTIFLLPWSPRF